MGTVKNNSEMLYTQARQLFEEAKTKFDNGTIKSEPLLIQSVFNAFQEFFVSIGQPNFKPRYASEYGPPWSEDYNDMMSELLKDLELLFREVDILGQSIYTDFNHNMVQQEALKKQYEQVLNRMNDLEVFAGRNETGLEFGRDNFLNKDKIDYSRISGEPLEIVDGAVTLPQIDRINVAKDATATIIIGNRQENKFILGTESNGFPGNNTEIHSVTDDVLTSKNYTPTFIGEENNHCDYSAVLDGSPNTWFEYEKVNVRDHDKIKVAKNLGWDYQVYENQTIRWAEDPDDGVLKLHIQITLPKEKVINQINCNMYTPPNYGAKTAIVKNILVSDGKQVPKSIMPIDKSDDQYSFHFSPVKAKIISVLFEQPHKYITDIGHIFYEKKMQVEDESEYAMDAATKKYKYAPRVEGPDIMLEDLGINVKVNETSVDASYPGLEANGQNKSSIGETINRLTNNVDLETVEMGVEKFEGFRWCIGIRDIEIYSSEYAEEGELVTHPFYFENPIDKISLDVDESIPESFISNDAMKYNWLSYFVSIDDGATWNPITPLKQQILSDQQPPKIYTVRTVETSDQILDSKEAYIESEYPVYSMRLKIVGKRPTEDAVQTFSIMSNSHNDSKSSVEAEKASPVISNYVFNIKTKVDAHDSEEGQLILSSSVNTGEKPKTNMGKVPDKEEEPQIDMDSISVEILNKKTEWCMDEDLVVKGRAKTTRSLEKVEIYIGKELIETANVDGKYADFSFTIPEYYYEESSTLTIIVRAYDDHNVAVDTDVINIIDCKDVPDEDRPIDRAIESLQIVVDKKPSEICECDTLSFYGSVQGPNDIGSLIVEINGFSIDVNDLGEAPENDPCGKTIGSASDEDNDKIVDDEVEIQSMTDEQLLQIEDFGEWLDAFEEREDCGCRNKRRKSQTSTFSSFQAEAAPMQMMDFNEEDFIVNIPYWKLKELGVDIGETIHVSLTAYDSAKGKVSTTFDVLVKDCEKPDYDEHGNPRVRECLLLESVTVHYYDRKKASIESITIPANALPYQHIDNGIGTGVTVGWRAEFNGPIIMVTKGFDYSGYAFQVHAVGVNYLNEYDQPFTSWSTTIAEMSEGVQNSNLMIGHPNRPAEWTQHILTGDYSSSPSLTGLNDYVAFIADDGLDNEICEAEMDFVPSENNVPDEDTPDLPDLFDCNLISDMIIQVFNDIDQELKEYVLNLNDLTKDTITLNTLSGEIKILAGWSNYFNGITLKVIEGEGKRNAFITAVGIVYRSKANMSQTFWVDDIRYQSEGVNNSDFIFDGLKVIEDLYWLEDEEIDFDAIPYLGSKGDMIAFSVSDGISDSICQVPINIDSESGIDINNPPDKASLEFIDVPEKLCINFEDSETIYIDAVAKYEFGLKEVEYSISANNIIISGPYTEEADSNEYMFSYEIDLPRLEAGDSVILTAKAKTVFGVETVEQIELIAENCSDWEEIKCNENMMAGSKYGKFKIDLGKTATKITIRYDMYSIPDKLDVYYKDTLIATTKERVSGSGTLEFEYNPDLDDTTVMIIVNDNEDISAGTNWSFSVSCPQTE
ncbi:hypothetical protein B14_200188 (plasmid) [Bacillus licheniformis]|uniref:hypothetical protein n=1 Tax=Bacillus licheniformis TaxID=1402 RepID=UPI0009B72C1B|nr:hypothetical protein [Bacillus licheniformis]ARC67399.1 hypothetical protein B14_200188 [Bacillus licheniformis]ARW46192.1 hypothetical protein S100141_04974 [Bacillus licheniformis]MDE1421829.1 hypothetical protein [Bacillus licheniformis]MEC0475834.1 hypothetical protein [Bacillus licheniformis]RHL11896.1 hypothetical protein DW032_19900 [Bacillus licheniformis]